MQKYSRLLSSFDWLLALAVFVLLVLGVSALYGIGLSFDPPDFTNVTKQVVALSIGLVIALVIALWNYRLLRSYAGTLYAFGGVALTLLLMFGVNIRGTTGWFSFGFFNIQPVEFVKIFLVVALAAILARRSRRVMRWREFMSTAIPVGIYVLLVMMQPDFGSAALMIGVWIVMLLFAGLDKKVFITLAASGTAMATAAWFFFFEEFQKNRLLTFINPELDPLGVGYNVVQAKIAIGAGRLFGRGLGFGSQSQLQFLPEAQTDFIFAAIAEELGFFGVLLVVTAFMLLFWRIWRLVNKTRDDFTGYLLIGLGSLLFIQMTVNIAMNLGMMPVTGLPLPFVSYGGSSLLSSMIIFGIVESVALRER